MRSAINTLQWVSFKFQVRRMLFLAGVSLRNFLHFRLVVLLRLQAAFQCYMTLHYYVLDRQVHITAVSHLTREDVILLEQCINSMPKLVFLENQDACTVLQLINYTSYRSLFYLGRELQGQAVYIQNMPVVYLVRGADKKLCTSFAYSAMKNFVLCVQRHCCPHLQTIMFYVQRRKNCA